MENSSGNIAERTHADISSILLHAKLNEDDFLNSTQILYINEENVNSDKYKLLELDDHLSKILTNQGQVFFKGSEDEDAVLCTDSRTYDIRECETSNSLLLVPNLEFKEDLVNESPSIKQKFVAGLNYKYLEAIPFKAQFDKIMTILEETKYKGPELEFEVDRSKLRTFNELLEMAQGSRTEFEEFLSKTDIIILNAKIRLLDFDYHFRVISYLLKSIEENSWALDEINKDETIHSWTEVVPEDVLEAVFNIYTEQSKVENSVILYKYKEQKVCQFFAKVLLEYAGKFNLNDFFEAWKGSVPEGMNVEEEMLNGIAIIDRNSKPNVIWAFPENKLPNTIPERFEALFNAKPKWSVSEITPYIESLTTEKLDANAILAKYARASTIEGVRYYSAKSVRSYCTQCKIIHLDFCLTNGHDFVKVAFIT